MQLVGGHRAEHRKGRQLIGGVCPYVCHLWAVGTWPCGETPGNGQNPACPTRGCRAGRAALCLSASSQAAFPEGPGGTCSLSHAGVGSHSWTRDFRRRRREGREARWCPLDAPQCLGQNGAVAASLRTGVRGAGRGALRRDGTPERARRPRGLVPLVHRRVPSLQGGSWRGDS